MCFVNLNFMCCRVVSLNLVFIIVLRWGRWFLLGVVKIRVWFFRCVKLICFVKSIVL